MAIETYRVEVKTGRKWVPAPFCHTLPLDRAREAIFDFVNRDIVLNEGRVRTSHTVLLGEYRIVNNESGEVLIQR